MKTQWDFRVSATHKFPFYNLSLGIRHFYIRVGFNFYEFGLGFTCSYIAYFKDVFLTFLIGWFSIVFCISEGQQNKEVENGK